jgi:hypothetical protein
MDVDSCVPGVSVVKLETKGVWRLASPGSRGSPAPQLSQDLRYSAQCTLSDIGCYLFVT